FEGEPYTFCPFIYGENEAALAGSRELCGVPKKLASLGYARRADDSPFGEQIMFTVEREARKRLPTVTMNPGTPGGSGGGELPARAHPAQGPEQPPQRRSSQHLRADPDRLLRSARDQRGWNTGAVGRPVLGDDGLGLRVRP